MTALRDPWDGAGRRAHFVGIGGAGMSALAEVLIGAGFRVSGSDRAPNEQTARLAGLGAEIREGHAAEAVRGADLVVWSSAVRPDNPELAAARAGGAAVLHRADLLAALLRERRGIAVAGAHGKTSTTALLGHILTAAGLDPTILAGGVMHGTGSGARSGQGPWLVAEADESDGSFLKLEPEVAVVTNVDREHLDHFGTYTAVEAAFRTFAGQARSLVVACADDAGARAAVAGLARPVVFYGCDAESGHGPEVGLRAPGGAAAPRWTARDVRLDGPVTCFAVRCGGEELGEAALPLVGVHYVRNALAALAAAEAAGVAPAAAVASLASFPGVGRRFTVLGEAGGVTVVDDYGHHPAEIAANLRAAREAFGRRLLVAFQAHRYSRTRDLLEAFADAFDAADELVVTSIYGAGEEPIPGVDAHRLARAIGARRPVACVPDRDDVVPWLAAAARPGDLLVLQGAGDLDRLAPALLARLAGR